MRVKLAIRGKIVALAFKSERYIYRGSTELKYLSKKVDS